jgi:hypothetical protein
MPASFSKNACRSSADPPQAPVEQRQYLGLVPAERGND